MPKTLISYSQLMQLLRYCNETGRFFWPDGSQAEKDGGQGYLNVWVAKATYRAHRLAWFYANGVWPKGEIDHINGIRNDNRTSNLRDVSRSTNQQNRRSPQRNNKCGFLGVSPNRNKFKATVRVGSKSHYVGIFDTPEKAHEAYITAKRALHSGCTI